MPRKSPRAKRKPDPAPRLPGKNRPSTAPGRGRKRVVAKAPRRGTPGHDSKGARSAAKVVRALVSKVARRRGPGDRARRGGPKAPSRRFRPPDPARVAAILETLERLYPDATTALHHRNAFELLIATILSAQCTDERVNMVTPALFERYPTPGAMAAASIPELEEMIRSTGFFHMKSLAIQSVSADLAARHHGEVPRTMEDLTALRGVGRKTANVVLGNAFDIPGLVVDTHVSRVSYRLGLTAHSDAVKIEQELMSIVPREKWTRFSHWLILHGRQVCIARKPRCSTCALASHCPRVGVTVWQ